MKFLFLSASMICSSVFFSGCCTNPQCSVNTTQEEMIAVRASGSVRIDGILNEKEWSGAVAYPMSEPVRKIPGDAPAKYAAHIFADPLEFGDVRLMYDKDYLYVGAKLKDSDVMHYGTDDQSMLFMKGDTLEIFVKPEKSPEYWECYATPNNKKTTLYFETRGYPQNPEKNVLQPGYKVAAKVHGTFNKPKDKDEGWTVEAAIPIKMLEKTGVRFVPGEAWTILIARYNYNYGSIEGGPRYSTYPKLPKINYHLTEYYAKLVRK